MKRPIYVLFNVFYSLIGLWVLLLVNTYYNGVLVPESWVFDDKYFWRFGFLLIESAIFLVIIFIINSLSLSDTEDKMNRTAIAKTTLKIEAITFLLFIILTISA